VVAPLALAVRGHGPRSHGAVVGGATAAEGQYPSAAFIEDVRGKAMAACSGTVIAPSLVLTAGHCAENLRTGAPNPGAGYRVLTGQADLAAGNGQVSGVIGVIPYPGYERRRDPGDAALLVLAKPVATPPMRLVGAGRKRLFRPGASATIAGWGKTSLLTHGPSERLRYASTVVQPARWCKRHIHPFFPKWELCTIDSTHLSTNGCFGDSGGPLMVPGSSPGEMVEVGIVALGNVRCSTRYPGVFTRVDALSRWLGSWMAAYRAPVVRQPTLTSPPIG
jgi:secreted trypsin-like serine protease